MEITTRAFWTVIHGMGFGALYLLACSGALMGLYRSMISSASSGPAPGHENFLRAYLIAMVFLAWSSVLSGAYIVYRWYRAVPPPGTVDLSMSSLVKSNLGFYPPTGPLSGVTTTSILIWLCAWGGLEWRWRKKTVAVGRISAVALASLGLGMALTFPPVADLF